MTAVGRGDQTAYAELSVRYRPLIAHWVRRYLSDAWVVDEVTQDVLLELWTIADRFDPARAVAPWVRTITQRRAIDRLRKLCTERERDLRIGARDLDVVDHASVERAESVLDRLALRRALRVLPARQREAVVLRHLVGLSGPELGVVLGVPTGTARTRARDGVLALRRVMTAPSGTSP
ncbi:hypothetical protein BIU90_11795 [Curtobacterium sp. MCBA15_001]|nr:hypothetical protein BIU90_11795 [Curtobacterium sp. MCBA15_001]